MTNCCFISSIWDINDENRDSENFLTSLSNLKYPIKNKMIKQKNDRIIIIHYFMFNNNLKTFAGLMYED